RVRGARPRHRLRQDRAPQPRAARAARGDRHTRPAGAGRRLAEELPGSHGRDAGGPAAGGPAPRGRARRRRGRGLPRGADRARARRGGDGARGADRRRAARRAPRPSARVEGVRERPTAMTPVHQLWLIDLLDILLVAVLFYRLLILVKGTRSAQMYVGLLVIVLVGLIAREFDLIAIRWIVDSLKTVWLIAFVILFQPELRHALALFGRTRYFRSFLRGDHYGVLGEVVRGVETLAERRHGALIALERNTGLRNFVETGTRIDAKTSAELLVTLFSPGSPLHDGAVILREDTVVAAACILPLSSNPRTAPMLGTRHRAGIGLSEETDAAIIVVSEQSGEISVAFRGRLMQQLNEGELRSELSRIFRIRPEEEQPAPVEALEGGETTEKAAG